MMNSKNSDEGQQLVVNSPALLLIGGFLGAGKTTLIQRLVRHFAESGKTCGVIANDQGTGLLDTSNARRSGPAAVAEVSGGCFCCRLEELVEVVKAMSANERPDVILAEPVGSCTDLVATVIRPLEQIYQIPLRLCPLTVLVDAGRALETFGGLSAKRGFAKDIGYIFHKQIEEAGVVAVSKCERLEVAERERIVAGISRKYPGKTVCFLSSRTGEGLADWLEAVTTFRPADAERGLEIDYEIYGKGEAMLGWYNATLAFEAPEAVDLNRWTLEFVERIGGDLADVEIAHLKAGFHGEAGGLMSAANLVKSGEAAELSISSDEGARSGTVLINLRAEADPDWLKERVATRIAATPGLRVLEVAAFRPGQPKPTHRIAVA
jgi:Ni2+-binding GTPase involved in maturation of urease and hydrogenase